jgi:hypothetical protein
MKRPRKEFLNCSVFKPHIVFLNFQKTGVLVIQSHWSFQCEFIVQRKSLVWGTKYFLPPRQQSGKWLKTVGLMVRTSWFRVGLILYTYYKRQSLINSESSNDWDKYYATSEYDNEEKNLWHNVSWQIFSIHLCLSFELLAIYRKEQNTCKKPRAAKINCVCKTKLGLKFVPIEAQPRSRKRL